MKAKWILALIVGVCLGWSGSLAFFGKGSGSSDKSRDRCLVALDYDGGMEVWFEVKDKNVLNKIQEAIQNGVKVKKGKLTFVSFGRILLTEKGETKIYAILNDLNHLSINGDLYQSDCSFLLNDLAAELRDATQYLEKRAR